MKPGNSVEDKTLMTREILGGGERFWQRTRRLTDGHMKSDPKPIPSEIKPGWPNFRRWDVGSCGRKAMVIPLKSRIRVAKKGTSKPKWDVGVRRRGMPVREKSGRSIDIRFQAQGAACNPAIFSVEKSHGGKWSET